MVHSTEMCLKQEFGIRLILQPCYCTCLSSHVRTPQRRSPSPLRPSTCVPPWPIHTGKQMNVKRPPMVSDATVSDPSLAVFNRIFVANLQNCTESELRTYFQDNYGPILSIHHVPNKFAFVTFVHERDAYNALVKNTR